MSQLEFTILGSGCSGGIPRADGYWGACDPAEPKNLRRRCSLLVRRLPQAGQGARTTIVVDTAPDFREQCCSAGVDRLDAALFTHDHADQCHGIDDLRGFFIGSGRRVDCWMDAFSANSISGRFDYIFNGVDDYPAICDLNIIPPHGTNWSVNGPSGCIPVTTFDQEHGVIRSVGYRFGDVAYSPDLNAIPEESFAALENLDVWIVDALRWAPHPSHAHVELALNWIERVKPRKAILTNLHYDLDYNALRKHLSQGVEPAFDGLSFCSPISDISDNIS